MPDLASVSKSMKSQDVEQLCRRVILATAVVIGCMAAEAALGQSPTATTTAATAKDATPQTHPNDPMLWNVDRMMEDAVQQISKRYSLNSEQEKYTRLMLTQRVRAFLKDHEADVRALLKEQLDWKLRFSDATSNSMQEWAVRAKPLYEEAMKAILDGNQEWGEILSDEQKKIHLGDLNQMKVNFDGVRVMLTRWEDGKGNPTEVQPWKQDKSTDKGITRTPPPPPPIDWRDRKIEDMWETYVIKFIQVYGLDEKQANAAHSIKREMQGEAAKHRDARKADFDAMYKLGGPDPRNPTNQEEVRKRKQMLERPIRDLFVKLTGRLDGLRNQTQRESIKPEDKQSLESQARTLASDSTVPIPAPKPQPTTKVAEDGGVTRASATSVPAVDPKAEKPVEKPAEKPAEKSAPAKPAESKPEAAKSEAAKAAPAEESSKSNKKDEDADKSAEAAAEKPSEGGKKPE